MKFDHYCWDCVLGKSISFVDALLGYFPDADVVDANGGYCYCKILANFGEQCLDGSRPVHSRSTLLRLSRSIVVWAEEIGAKSDNT